MMDEVLKLRAEALRRFNRTHTSLVGLLQQAYLDSGLSLTEVRVIYEIANGDGLTISDLARDLILDNGYLSRLVRGLKDRGLITAAVSQADGRQQILALTADGAELYRSLSGRSQSEMMKLISGLGEQDQRNLMTALQSAGTLLARACGRPAPTPVVTLRSHRPGDMGWVISAHGRIYATEFGWDHTFEAMVADIAAAFLRDFDPEWEHCWMAEIDGVPVGSVTVVRKSPAEAQLRLLIIDPSARGLRLGERMVEECIRFAKSKGYGKLVLWTNDNLHAARRIYQKAGFRLVEEEPHHSFGVDLVGQNWELEL
ncbi:MULTISPECIES: helix-turn-helix domain-containing GNAT family N-acetyltransferase [unclassified Minwuia]|jgi:DNA-binding MarR family transcriptional regulator/GNAT superfamily N-acetyltransferase|uniref:bifunctional helix-turn-helix transcriptional regulator/GNAT family N-acetyltransferase n=1 Tax=unclassified Minwuia TaxID=2618799 RepID=UPI00247AAFE4|nr:MULTISPECIES: helix-turn-helix domain-containing GNAT family N-acetyltransferase [unclassified Minwuia]